MFYRINTAETELFPRTFGTFALPGPAHTVKTPETEKSSPRNAKYDE